MQMQSTRKSVISTGSLNIWSSLYLSHDSRSWVSLMNDFFLMLLHLLALQIVAKATKTSQMIPACKEFAWTCWQANVLYSWGAAQPWLLDSGCVVKLCFSSGNCRGISCWDAHSWVARAIALLLPHQGTARPRTTRRPWLQRPQKSQKTKSTGVLQCWLIQNIQKPRHIFLFKITKTQTEESQKLPKFANCLDRWMQRTSLSGAPEWLVGCCRRSLPPKVLGSGSLAPSHGTTHTGFEDGLRKDWEMLTNIEIIRLEPLGDVLSISSSSNATTTSANHLLLPSHSHRQNMAQCTAQLC